MVENILISLFTGIVVSLFFWWITVCLPQKKKKRIIVNNFRRMFIDFKVASIRMLLVVTNEYINENQVNSLLDYENFRKFYQGRLVVFHNAIDIIQEQEEYLNKLLIDLEILSHAGMYLVNNIDILNKDVFYFFKTLQENVFCLKHNKGISVEQNKYLYNMLWSYLANYSKMDGYYDADSFDNVMSKI